jgi:basic amino acid/polyamine antiporter, APA family
VLLVIGNVIGSGIFLTSGVMLDRMPSDTLFLLAWVMGGILALCGALTYAEMGAMFPRSGGLLTYLREAYGPLTAFLFGWASLLVILTGQIGAISVGFSEAFSYFFPYFSSSHALFFVPLPWAPNSFAFTGNKLVAVSAIGLLGALNYVNARGSNRLNAVLTVGKVAGICALPVLAILFGRSSLQWSPVVAPHMNRVAASFGVAMIGVLWAYDGWQYVPFAAGEIRNPQRNIPRALSVGVLLTVGIFVAVNLAYLRALTMPQMRGVVRVGEKAAAMLGGAPAARFISLVVLVSAFGCCAAMMLVSARLFFAMSREGIFPKQVGSIHRKFETPHIAVLLTTVCAMAYAITGSYEQLYTYVIFGGIIFAVLGGSAVFVLRRKHPSQERPYRVWGYPIVPLVFIVGMFALLVNTLTEKPLESLTGLGLILLGLPAYFSWRKPSGASDPRNTNNRIRSKTSARHGGR